MTIPELVYALTAAGASAQAISIAVKAVEEAELAILTRREADRLRKKKSRTNHVNDADKSRDGHVTEIRIGHVTEAAPRVGAHAGVHLAQNLEVKKESKKRAQEAAFDRFWSAWPHKVGKLAAEGAFAKHFLEIDAIMVGLQRYVRDKPPDRSWLNPSTFLNQRRWEDQPAKVDNFNGKSVHAAAQQLCDDIEAGALSFGPAPEPYVLAVRREREREEAVRLLSQG